jgi:hypothetical protein
MGRRLAVLVIKVDVEGKKTMKNLRHMVWLSKSEMSLTLNALDRYAEQGKGNLEVIGDIREKIALARYGKIKITEIPSIRAGRRVPKEISK